MCLGWIENVLFSQWNVNRKRLSARGGQSSHETQRLGYPALKAVTRSVGHLYQTTIQCASTQMSFLKSDRASNSENSLDVLAFVVEMERPMEPHMRS